MPTRGAAKAVQKYEKEMSKLPHESAPALNPQNQKKCSSPSCPVGNAKQLDNTTEVIAIKLKGGMAIQNFVRGDGNSAYKADITQAVTNEKEGTEKLDVMKVVNHKAERTEDLEKVLVGKKKNISDKGIVTFCEAGDNENKDITAQIPVGVQLFKRYTQPYKEPSSGLIYSSIHE